MENAMKVYLVSTGDYSEKYTSGIYSTRELAEQAKLLLATDNEIEEIELDEFPKSQCPAGMHSWRVHISSNGEDTQVLRNDDTQALRQDSLDRWGFTCHAYAADEQHAAKIATERRRMAVLRSDGVIVRTDENGEPTGIRYGITKQMIVNDGFSKE